MKSPKVRLQYFENVSPKQKSNVSVSPTNKKKFQSQSIVQQQIKQNGSIVIRRSSSVQYQSKVLPHYMQALNQQILKKKQQMNNQMNKLDKYIQENKHRLQNAKNKAVQEKLIQMEALKNKQLKKKQEVIQKVSKWSKQRSELQKHRQVERLKRQEMLKQQQKKKKDEEEKYSEFAKLEKRKQIELRIRDMEKKRQQRLQNYSQQLKNHSSLTSIPKYKVLEKQFIDRQHNLQNQLSLSRKNKKVQKALDPEQIKAHEKAYIQRIKERLNMKKKQGQEVEGTIRRKVKSQFNLYLNRKDEQLKLELQKLKKRQKFQQKIRQIPVHVDQQKRLQREIAADKADNPLKYNFLSQKALSQQQIFKEFKDFQMNIDSKKLGKQYLQKLKAQPKTRISKSTLVEKVQAASEKPQYKNYLQEVKIKKRPKLDQFEQLKRQYKNNRKIGSQVLGKKSEQYEGKALKKIKELKIANTYEESVKKQSQIDDMYTRSLKARIAVLQLN